MLNRHRAHADLLDLTLLAFWLTVTKEIRYSMLIALRKIQITSTRMTDHILYIFCETYKCSICPEAEKLLPTTLCKEKHI